MRRTSKEYARKIKDAVEDQNFDDVSTLCEQLIDDLFQSKEVFVSKGAEKIVASLRSKRLFTWMEKVGDAFIQTKRSTFTIHRQYAQALIDQGNLTAAVFILNDIINQTALLLPENEGAKREHYEAWGLIGRLFKQLYINAKGAKSLLVQEYLKKAVDAYLNVYLADPKAHLWHGINAVALLRRAQRDQIDVGSSADPFQIAQDILETVEENDGDEDDNGKLDMWDLGTAAEACLALEKAEEAERWLRRYVRYANEFARQGTLRQFTEVWQLVRTQELGSTLLPLLESESGRLEKFVSSKEESVESVNEAVFSEDTYKTHDWYKRGDTRCEAVARIGKEPKVGKGTGFLLKASSLNVHWSDEFVLVTNAHVLSDDLKVEAALRSHQACIVFETIKEEMDFKVGKILWSSPPTELDVTIIQFAKEDYDKVMAAKKELVPYPICRIPPVVTKAERVYAIGHPSGGTLSISLQDNVLLDYRAPLLHYRTPTEGGSSGSPLFDEQWQLIGVHHKGSPAMAKLNGEKGRYQANEGIEINAILAALQDVPVPL